MTSTPTLQDLAVDARDAFGEDGAPSTTRTPASFDVVVEIYAQTGDLAPAERLQSQACTALTRALVDDGQAPATLRRTVPAFVSKTLQYLRTQYPESGSVRQDQHLLSTLFWGHLIEARHAWHKSG